MLVSANSVNLAEVLAAVVPGQTVPFDLTSAQRDSLRDPDGRLALYVIGHLIAAREAVGAPGRTPITELAVQAVAQKLGVNVGQKRCRLLRRRLVDAGVMAIAGAYAARSGYRVRLYVVAARVRRVARPAHKQRPPGTRSSVKPRRSPRWWQHPLFGNPNGLPPPGISRVRLRRMVSLDELMRQPKARLR